jgi:hypothetical protein
MAKKKRPKTPGEKPRSHLVKEMDQETVRLLVGYLLRSPVVIAEARPLLKPEHFGAEPHFEFLVQVLYDLLAEDDYPDGIVPYLTIREACRERYKSAPEVMTQNQKNWLFWKPPYTPEGMNNGVLYWAHKELKRRDLDNKAGLDLLKRFLKERALMGDVRGLLDLARDGYVVDNYAEVSDHIRLQDERIEAISTSGSRGMRPKTGKVTPVVPLMTGLPFFDDPMGGGPAASEVVGIAGPTGGGKSTAMYQLGTRFAEFHPDLLVLHFAYEDDQDRMDQRVWACTGLIDKAVLAQVTDPEEAKASGLLSSVGKLKPYDRAMFPGRPVDQLEGEYERLMAVWNGYQNYRMFDMTVPGRGAGGLDEVVAMIRREVSESGKAFRGVGLVIIDSLDIIVENSLDARGLPKREHLRYEINEFPNKIRRRVGKEFGAAIFLVNQIAGENLKRSAGARFSHADAAESKGWAKGLDFCANFGNTELKGEEGRKRPVTVLNYSKARRTGAVGWHSTIRLIGNLGYWEDCSKEYGVYMGNIVAARDMIGVADVGQLAAGGTSAEQADKPPWL